MLGDRQGRGFRITQLRAVASSPTISTIRDISLVLGGVAGQNISQTSCA
jgi:hypothetical protein